MLLSLYSCSYSPLAMEVDGPMMATTTTVMCLCRGGQGERGSFALHTWPGSETDSPSETSISSLPDKRKAGDALRELGLSGDKNRVAKGCKF